MSRSQALCLPRGLIIVLALLCGSERGLAAPAGLDAEAPVEAPEDEKRPNILFAFADDWGRYASAYARIEPGGPSDIVKTPHFDRVAREGALFRNAFVNAPSCTPCRSSLLSGQHFWRTGRGAILSGAVWDPEIPSYPLLLRDAGYHIGFTNKVWSPGTPRDAPHGGQEFAFARRGRRVNGYSQLVSSAPDRDAARRQLADEVRGNFRDFLAAREGRPFSYWFGPTNAHRKWTRGSGRDLWGLDPDALKGKLPTFLPDVPVVREDFADYLGEVQAFDASLGVLLDELERTGQLDRTLVVVSGDHGAPGFPRGKCNLYDFGMRVPLAVRWPARVPGSRVVDDLVGLPDLAPTFLEVAGLAAPKSMTARSLLPVLSSTRSGQIDPRRDFVVFGRERHVDAARPGRLPYPQRAIRTHTHLYIRNFAPERWPMGVAPGFGEPPGEMPDLKTLANNTRRVFGDLDASPTKAWMILNRDEPAVAPLFALGFARRPAEELYELTSDPHQIRNLAGDAEHAPLRERLAATLMRVLRETGDPRVLEDPVPFERPPYAGPRR